MAWFGIVQGAVIGIMLLVLYIALRQEREQHHQTELYYNRELMYYKRILTHDFTLVITADDDYIRIDRPLDSHFSPIILRPGQNLVTNFGDILPYTFQLSTDPAGHVFTHEDGKELSAIVSDFLGDMDDVLSMQDVQGEDVAELVNEYFPASHD